MKEISNIRLNHEPWTVRFVTKRQMPDKCWGDANNKLKEMRVRTDLSDKNFLDTFIHEMLHAANFDCFSEEFVEHTATEMTKALLASGRVKVVRD